MKSIKGFVSTIILLFGLPSISYCQVLDGQLKNFQDVLENLRVEMISLAEEPLLIAQLIGAFGALWYIGVRVWKHFAAAEPIDFFPLLRPFVIAIVISIYPSVLSIMEGILSPTVIVTQKMVQKFNDPVAVLIEDREKTIRDNAEWQDLAGGLHGDREDFKKYEQKEEASGGLSLGKALTFSISLFTNSLNILTKLFFSFLLQLLYFAASLCIDAMRTFILLILGILGPFVLSLSIYDGFQHILPIWIARYVNVYLWLPIANLLAAMIGKIQEDLLKIDLTALQQGQLSSFGQTDVAYLIFLLIGIIGYFCVPSIANYIVHASGANTIVSKTTSTIMTAASYAAGGSISGQAGAGAAGSSGAGSMTSSTYGNDMYSSSMANAANSEPYLKEGGGYDYDKLSGNS